MAFSPVALIIPQYEDYSGWWLKAYEQGTVTPLVMATDSTGVTTLAKCYIDSTGFPRTSSSTNSPRFIPYINGSYDLWLFPTEEEANGDITVNAIQFADNVNADAAAALVSEWHSALIAIRTSDTVFTVIGDKRDSFKEGKRIKATGGADRYASVSEDAVFTTLTTVTVVNVTDNTGTASTLHASMDTVLESIQSVNNYAIYPRYYRPLPGETGVINYEYDYVDIKRFGATIGSANNNTAIQNCIDSNKGLTIIIPVGDYFHSGILLDGSTYDNTTIKCIGRLKLIADAGSTNFGGAWVGLIIKDCDGVIIDYKGDGNRSNMTDVAGIHLVGIAGASNLSMPTINIKEIRGDGVYISQSSWTSNSTTPTNINIGDFKAFNSADDGRNALSVISVDGLTIGAFQSTGIGSTVNSVRQPGGLDIEPNFGYQSCKNISIGAVRIKSAGTTGLAIEGKAITNDATEDWCVDNVAIDSFIVEQTNGTSATTVLFRRARNINISGTVATNLTTIGAGVNIDYVSNITANFVINTASVLCRVGWAGIVRDFNITINGDIYGSTGLISAGVVDGRFLGRITGATSSSSTFAIQTRSNSRGLTQTDVHYSIDVPYDGNNSRAFRNEPTDTVAYTDSDISQCDMRGYASFAVQVDAQIPTRYVTGRDEATAQPGAGAWVQGDFIRRSNTSAVDGNNMFIFGWQRITTGTGNVAGTDWLVGYISNVTPAT